MGDIAAMDDRAIVCSQETSFSTAEQACRATSNSATLACSGLATLPIASLAGAFNQALSIFTVPDWQGLVKVGEFDPTYLHLSPKASEAASPEHQARQMVSGPPASH